MWVARDKDWENEKGKLRLYNAIPHRACNGTCEFWYGYGYEIDGSLFPDLKWEDEPLRVVLHPERLELIKGKPCDVCSHMSCLSNDMVCILDEENE